MKESDPRARSTLKGPKTGSRHPAKKRSRRSRTKRCQRTAATPDFPPTTGVTAGTQKAEKQTVEDQHRSIATVATTVAKPSDGARRMWTTLECRPSLRPVTDGPGRLAHSYGSDAHPGKRVAPLMPDRPVVSHWPEPAGQARLTCYADRRCPRPSSRRSIAPLRPQGPRPLCQAPLCDDFASVDSASTGNGSAAVRGTGED